MSGAPCVVKSAGLAGVEAVDVLILLGGNDVGCWCDVLSVSDNGCDFGVWETFSRGCCDCCS